MESTQEQSAGIVLAQRLSTMMEHSGCTMAEGIDVLANLLVAGCVRAKRDAAADTAESERLDTALMKIADRIDAVKDGRLTLV